MKAVEHLNNMIMRNTSTINESQISAYLKAVLLLTVLAIWILIDTGNAYGQSKFEVSTLDQDKEPTEVAAKSGNDKGSRGAIEDPEQGGFTIYPVPTENELVFDFEFTVKTEEISLQVIDPQGRIVFNQFLDGSFFNQRHTLDMSAQPNGTYVVVVRKGARVFTKQLLKI
jgi:hypothetical protein